MRTIIVLAFACLALASTFPPLEVHLKSLIQTGYAVDTVVQLLIAMDRASNSHLQTLIDNWANTDASFQARIAGLQDLDTQQHAHCDLIDGTIVEINNEIARYGDYINQAQAHIDTNTATLQDRLAKRCVSNLLFVEKLKANQDGVRLLTFLREKVADPGFAAYLEGNNGAFVELSHSLKSGSKTTFSLIAKHHMFAQIQQAYTGEENFVQIEQTYTGEDSDLHYDLTARTSQEIGTGYIDNSQGALSLDQFTIDARNLDDFIAELLGFIDNLIQELKDENTQLQANEFNAVENLIDYQDQVENENSILGVYIEQWTNHINDLTGTLAQDVEASNDCHDRATSLDNSLESAQTEYADATADFNTRQASLSGTVTALETIIDLYTDKVLGASEVYKQRIDDELNRARATGPSSGASAAPAPSGASAAPVSTNWVPSGINVSGGDQSQPSYVEEEDNSGETGDYRHDSNTYGVQSWSNNQQAANSEALGDKQGLDNWINGAVSAVSGEIGSGY